MKKSLIALTLITLAVSACGKKEEPAVTLLAAVDHELDRQLQTRARQIVADPTDYHLHILGPVPTDPDHQATWMRGATILERHDIGLDPGPTNPPHVGLATLRDVAETRARLEAMAIPGAARPAGQAVQPNHGIELG